MCRNGQIVTIPTSTDCSPCLCSFLSRKYWCKGLMVRRKTCKLHYGWMKLTRRKHWNVCKGKQWNKRNRLKRKGVEETRGEKKEGDKRGNRSQIAEWLWQHVKYTCCHDGVPWWLTKASTLSTVRLCLQLNMTATMSTLNQQPLELGHHLNSWRYSSPGACCADNSIRPMFTGWLSNCCFNHGTMALLFSNFLDGLNFFQKLLNTQHFPEYFCSCWVRLTVKLPPSIPYRPCYCTHNMKLLLNQNTGQHSANTRLLPKHCSISLKRVYQMYLTNRRKKNTASSKWGTDGFFSSASTLFRTTFLVTTCNCYNHFWAETGAQGWVFVHINKPWHSSLRVVHKSTDPASNKRLNWGAGANTANIVWGEKQPHCHTETWANGGGCVVAEGSSRTNSCWVTMLCDSASPATDIFTTTSQLSCLSSAFFCRMTEWPEGRR